MAGTEDTVYEHSTLLQKPKQNVGFLTRMAHASLELSPLPAMLSGYRNVVKTGNNLVLNSKKAGKTNNIDMVRSQ